MRRESVVGRVRFEPLEDGSLVVTEESLGESGATTTLRWTGREKQDAVEEEELKSVSVALGQCYVLTCVVKREKMSTTATTAVAAKPFVEPPAVDSYFSRTTHGNEIAVLVDGLQTFERYFHVMTGARHSINILAWELSLSFGLIRVDRCQQQRVSEGGMGWVVLI